ncbi:uncharacterized protein LOC125650898 [Ostrea edulis]|uniref:uncharacterized protein LOC125650898 n=1 Tax=Ostrea edulis TaxID=37623 RepID=UPI0024AEC108|nr:uncharacterized protein LOC125650898 [Ostrea edulis]
MGPKRSNRSVPYNPELPANWTSARLRETLNSRGINFPTNARRSVLIRLIEENENENPINRPTQSHNDTSHNATQRVNNNGEQRVLVDLVSKLTSTVQSLQQSVVSLNTRVNSLTAQANIQSDNAVAGRPLLRTETARNATRVTTGNNEPPTSAGLSTVHVSTDSLPISPTNESRGYDLASAFSAFQSRQVSAAAGSPGQLNNVRTTYGYASESLPLVETISPQLRQQIVSDAEIPNLSSPSQPLSSALRASFGDDDRLDQELQGLWEASLNQSTRKTYSSALQCFQNFMIMNGAKFSKHGLPLIQESDLVYFVTHCKSVLKLKHDTIKLYLAGIRFHYIKSGLGDVLKGCDQLHYVLRGVKRLQSNVHHKRFPITTRILAQIWNVLDQGVFSPFVDLMLKCMYSCAFFGFLRCGEITCKSQNVEQFLQISDVHIKPGGSAFVLKLRTSKTDPFSKGVEIVIFENDHFKPVYTMISYLDARKSLFSSNTGKSPLFVDNEFNLKPMPRDTFVLQLKEILLRIGYDDNKFSGHSFRIGAATAAAAAGVEDHVIKELGRWSSDCYNRYIRTDVEAVQKAQVQMSYL